MSRVAKNPVKLPAGVEINLAGQQLSVKGAKGTLELNVHSSVEVLQEAGELRFAARNGDQQTRAMAGTTRALVNNMVIGVSTGFERKLQLVGVGYKAQAKGQVLNLALGFSHPIDYELPDGVVAETPTQTEILIKGVDKQLVGQVAAEIRDFRRPEPYKGKGVRYADEVVRRKEAKKNASRSQSTPENARARSRASLRVSLFAAHLCPGHFGRRQQGSGQRLYLGQSTA